LQQNSRGMSHLLCESCHDRLSSMRWRVHLLLYGRVGSLVVHFLRLNGTRQQGQRMPCSRICLQGSWTRRLRLEDPASQYTRWQFFRAHGACFPGSWLGLDTGSTCRKSDPSQPSRSSHGEGQALSSRIYDFDITGPAESKAALVSGIVKATSSLENHTGTHQRATVATAGSRNKKTKLLGGIPHVLLHGGMCLHPLAPHDVKRSSRYGADFSCCFAILYPPLK